MSLSLKANNTTSAPTSPAKGVSSFLSRATSLTGSVTNTVQQIARVTSQAAAAIKDHHKILLVIDDHIIDWSKYFRGRRLLGDWDIKVEQAEFKDIKLSANSELGAIVSIHTRDRNGFKIARTFRPDFVLVRQHVRDVNNNFNDIIVGLKYGLVSSINSLQSLYNFQDKTWVFSNLLALQRKHGKENFPLIEQTFFPSHKELSQIPKFPCVVKIGQSHNGLGKMKIDNLQQYQDIRSILMISNTYCIIEPFIDAKHDLHIQKIGSNYKAFTRKSVSGNWKANIGSALIEQVPMTERYKKWLDDTSEAFGGLDICSIETVVAKDGKEYIIEVCGSNMPLFGESQEDDRKSICDLIIQRMNMIHKITLVKQQSRASISSYNESDIGEQRQNARASITSLQSNSTKTNNPVQAPGIQPAPNRRNSTEMNDTLSDANNVSYSENNPFVNRDSFSSTTANTTNDTTINKDSAKPPLNKRESQISIDEIKEEVDDTMRNLRKTFAGIFGDM